MHLVALKNAGFNVVSIANNHMFDYQGVALQDTMANLQKAGIDYVGAGNNETEAFSLKIKEIQVTETIKEGKSVYKTK